MSDLLAYEMPIERTIEDNSLKDMTAIEDDRILEEAVGERYHIPFFRIQSEKFHHRPETFHDRVRDAMRRTVNVNRQELLEKLKENREIHAKIYAEALAGYKAAVLEALQKTMDRLYKLKEKVEATDEIKKVNLLENFEQPVFPNNALEAYDEAIELFTWDKAEKVELTMDEFRSFILDKWDWQREFLRSTAEYSGSARLRAMALED